MKIKYPKFNKKKYAIGTKNLSAFNKGYEQCIADIKALNKPKTKEEAD